MSGKKLGRNPFGGDSRSRMKPSIHAAPPAKKTKKAAGIIKGQTVRVKVKSERARKASEMNRSAHEKCAIERMMAKAVADAYVLGVKAYVIVRAAIAKATA